MFESNRTCPSELLRRKCRKRGSVKPLLLDDVATGFANAYQLTSRSLSAEATARAIHAETDEGARVDVRLLLFPLAAEVVLESPVVSRRSRTLAVRSSIRERRNFDAAVNDSRSLCLTTLADVVKPLVELKAAKS